MIPRRRSQTSLFFKRPTHSRDESYGRTSKDVVVESAYGIAQGGQS
jgi:hypothetical protein